MKSLLTLNEYVEGILQKDISILSRAITLVESTLLEHQQLATEIIEKLLPSSGNSVRLGITGVPGVGKSTFIESFGQLVADKKHKVAVLAVDPSSKLSKGSILGDKTRMEKLSTRKDVYIRPSPSAGSLGGVAQKTRETILLCEAAGFDYIIIETVGVGQSETEVYQLSDFFLLLMLAGAGDELQGIKRGIMEMADGLVITKADGNNMEKAKTARAEYAHALHLFPPTESGWTPQVKTCSSTENMGIEEVYEMVDTYVHHTKTSGYFDKNRQHQNVFWFENLVNEKIKQHFFHQPDFIKRYQKALQEIENKSATVSAALQFLFNEKN